MPSTRSFDVVVVGSGFGGSVAALRLTEKGYRVAVLEAGRRFGADDFPRTNWNLRRYLFFPRLGLRGILRLTLLRDVLVLSGAGVGGGSLVYANTLYEPLEPFWREGGWARIADWQEELAPHFERARRMLGAAPVPFETPADRVMQRVAERLGVADTYRRTEVGVWFGSPGEEVADPYFGGAGPPRRGCIGCGGCMVGCRHGAKNTLDRNYLYLAERGGAEIVPECEAKRILPRPEGGYQVVVRRPGGRGRGTSFRAEQVVLAAGVLGTLRLLFASPLPELSGRLGDDARTNSETIVGATARSRTVDYSRGVAIGSSIQPTPDVHIEPVRYPRGSNAMGLLGTLLVDGGPAGLLAAAARHPVTFLRSLSVYRWSERTIILLVMQARPESLRLRLRRGRLVSRRAGPPTSDGAATVAGRAARAAAEEMDGVAGGSLNEVLLGIPTTAHILGGACVAETPAAGVIDAYHRVFGHPGLHVVDGSAVSGNLGVNPALTITALAERALSLWPNRGEPDARPPLGASYVKLDAVAPAAPLAPY